MNDEDNEKYARELHEKLHFFSLSATQEVLQQRERILQAVVSPGVKIYSYSQEFKELTKWLFERFNQKITPGDLVHTNPYIRYEAQRRYAEDKGYIAEGRDDS